MDARVAAVGPDLALLFRTMVEIVDPRMRRVVYRSSLDRVGIIDALRNNRLVSYSVDGDSNPFVTILELRLTGT